MLLNFSFDVALRQENPIDGKNKYGIYRVCMLTELMTGIQDSLVVNAIVVMIGGVLVTLSVQAGALGSFMLQLSGKKATLSCKESYIHFHTC